MNEIYTIEDYAEAILERPSDAAFWDERLYTSHAPIYAWAERGDDILVESNYRTILDYLMQFTENENADEDVIDASIKHWAVGSLRQLFVRVYSQAHTKYEAHVEWALDNERDPYDWDEFFEMEDEVPSRFTRVFEGAWEVYEALRDYPVWDENDYYELESEYTDKAYQNELDYFMAHDEDFPDELEGDLAVTLRILWNQSPYGYHEAGYVNGDDIKGLLAEAQRIEQDHLANLAGQTALDMQED